MFLYTERIHTRSFARCWRRTTANGGVVSQLPQSSDDNKYGLAKCRWRHAAATLSNRLVEEEQGTIHFQNLNITKQRIVFFVQTKKNSRYILCDTIQGSEGQSKCYTYHFKKKKTLKNPTGSLCEPVAVLHALMLLLLLLLHPDKLLWLHCVGGNRVRTRPYTHTKHPHMHRGGAIKQTNNTTHMRSKYARRL